ncbi:sensor histidine kinase [Arcobacter nitrofigilis]|uniref:sensor histidine kinase n=1 Tax=Arcobacter nitrofigilis TaxID=28199 RepID=UPI00167F5213|nr:HAMP domain-containing sensor histidine kinase [Arcobacter nitrofigilis]
MSLEANSIANIIVYVNTDGIILNDGYKILDYSKNFMEKDKSIKSIIFSKTNEKNYVIKRDTWSYENKIDDTYTNLEKDQPSYKIIYSPILKEKVFHYVFPIIFSDTKWGWLHISVSLDKYNKLLENMYGNFIMFFLLILFIIICLSYFIAKLFAEPIIHLNEITKNIAKGQFELRSNYKSNDELGELANSFNHMLQKIELSHKELKKSNKQLKSEIQKGFRREALLIQQSRLAAMGEMIGNIAHQWRQPLSVITTAASGMKLIKELGINEDKKAEVEKLTGIINSSNYLSKTIDDFRNFFKEDKEKEYFNIKQKVEDSLRLVKDTFEFHFIKVEKNYTTDKKAYGISNEYSQALLNILSNAKDAVILNKIKEPKIKIYSFEKDNYVCLRIEDNAGGIKNNVIKKIFDPYFTTKHKSQGTGIGLYMSKVIIEQNMHGKLEVENSKEGAVFTISLPIKKNTFE